MDGKGRGKWKRRRGRRGGRMEGEMEVGRKENGGGRYLATDSCVLPISTDVSELLEVTRRLHVHGGEAQCSQKMGS